MPGSGVRSGRRWDTLRGFQKNKNKIKISLWQGFKGGHHIQERLFKKTQSLPVLLWAKQWFKRGVMDSLESPVVKPLTFTGMPFVPDHFASSSPQRSRKLSHHFWNASPLGGRTAAPPPGPSSLRKTKKAPSPAETAGRAEHWSVINCSSWNWASTPRLTTYLQGRNKRFNKLRKKRSKNHTKTDSRTYPAVAYCNGEWMPCVRRGRLGSWVSLKLAVPQSVNINTHITLPHFQKLASTSNDN